MGSGSTSSWTTLGSGGMVSTIEWIVTTSSCEDSILTTVNEPRCVEIVWANSGLKYDVFLEVRIVLDSANRDHLRLPEITFGGKGGFKFNLRERQGIGFFSSMINDLFWPKINNQNKRVMLGKRVYQETVNYRMAPGEPRIIGRQSPRMLCSVYHNVQGGRLGSLWMDST